jgi:septal ring factor EnvC (AmiA/AmiB activator)
MPVKELATLLLFAAASLAFVRPGAAAVRVSAGHTGRNASGGAFTQSLSMNATDEQRMAFAYCVSATEAVRRLSKRMVSLNSHWRYNTKVFPGQKEQLRSSVANMTEVHEQFLQSLSQAQAKALSQDLKELEQLQTELNAELSQLDEEWTSSRSDRGNIATSVYRIRKIADRWRSGHGKIATEMGIPR